MTPGKDQVLDLQADTQCQKKLELNYLCLFSSLVCD